jgi:hypothetical protein
MTDDCTEDPQGTPEPLVRSSTAVSWVPGWNGGVA